MADMTSQDAPSTPMDTAGSASTPAPDGGDAAGGGDDQDMTLVTICKKSDGTYMVYAGDEPDAAEGGDVSGDDASGGDMGAPAGTPADSVGSALKATLDILKADEAGGDGGPQAGFNAGFDGGSNASPAKPSMPMDQA